MNNSNNKEKIKARMWDIMQIINQLNAEYQKLFQELVELEKVNQANPDLTAKE